MPVTMAVFHAKRFEPVKRNHGNGPEYIGHRFPIVGGISLLDVMRRTSAEYNVRAAWEKLFKRKVQG